MLKIYYFLSLVELVWKFSMFCKLPETFYKYLNDACTIFMHENLTLAKNSYIVFLCNIQNLNAADNFQNFHKTFQGTSNIENCPCTFLHITCNQNLVIVIIHSFHRLRPLKGFLCNRCFSIGKIGNFSNL